MIGLMSCAGGVFPLFGLFGLLFVFRIVRIYVALLMSIWFCWVGVGYGCLFRMLLILDC